MTKFSKGDIIASPKGKRYIVESISKVCGTRLLADGREVPDVEANCYTIKTDNGCGYCFLSMKDAENYKFVEVGDWHKKALLGTDLTGRLMYGVKLWVGEGKPAELLEHIDTRSFIVNGHIPLDEVKPYLRTLNIHNFTEEEYTQVQSISDSICFNGSIAEYGDNFHISISDIARYIDFLNAHHFDWHGLIERGLALEAGKDTYANTTMRGAY